MKYLKKFLLPAFIYVIVLCLSVLEAGEIDTYPLPSVYPVSQTFTLEVDGDSVPVTEFIVKDKVQYHYAHLSFSNSINISVGANDNIESCEIRPKAFNHVASINGSEANFSISEPQYLVLYINDFEKLIILADPLESDPPEISDPDVTSILEYNVDTTGATIETEKVQQALNDVNANGGGVLYFPVGLYTVTNVNVKSNTTVYLEGGAVIRGTGKKKDYEEYSPGMSQRATHVFTIDGAENIRFKGRGTIDGHGVQLGENASEIWDVQLKIRAVSTENSSNIQIDGIIAREMTSWTVPFYYSDNINVSRVKVLNYPGWKHSDGINMCASQQGTVEDCFVITGDDAFCSKDFGGEPTHDIKFKNCVGYSNTRGVTLGMQAYDQLYDIVYDGIYMVGTRDGIDFKHNDGPGDWKDVTIKNVYVDECWGTPYNMQIQEGGTIKDVTIENYQCQAYGNNSHIKGYDADNMISNVSFINLKINDHLILQLEENFEINDYAENIVFASVDSDTTHSLGRMEAEDMIKANCSVQSTSKASGEEVVVYSADSGRVSYYFTAASGNFDINIGCWTESNSKGVYKLYIGDNMVSSWSVGEDSETLGNGFNTKTIQNIQISTGQKISVVGIPEEDKISGIDYVEITHFDGYYPEEIEIEAESGNLGSGWTKQDDEQASNREAISSQCENCLENPPSDTTEIARYRFNVLEGAYKLWLRVKHLGDNDKDDFWFRFNDNDWQKFEGLNSELLDGQYYWYTIDEKYELNEGGNVLEIVGCEKGAMLDQIFISQTGSIPKDSTEYDIYLEAESAIVGSEWSILESSKASNNQYIVSERAQSMSNAPTDTSEITIFNFQALAGRYKVWVRMRHPDRPNDDSFWLRVNERNWIEWNLIAEDKNDTDFHWDVYTKEFVLLPGTNTLEIGIREDGAELDMIYLSNSGKIPELPSTSVDKKKALSIDDYKLYQNYPNPFNPTTKIKYKIKKSGNVQLKVYNLKGQIITNLVYEHKQAGKYSVIFDASNFSSGIYYYRLEVGGKKKTRKMLLIK